MIIFMAGLPFAGKTFVVDSLLGKIKQDALVISPKDFREDNYEKLSEPDRREMDIAAWAGSLEYLWVQIQARNDGEIVIYDTACASLDKMRPYFEGAGKNRHAVIYVFVHAGIRTCRERAGEKWLPKEVIDSYKSRFKDSVEKFCEIADHHVVVKNNSSDDPDVSKLVNLVNSLCK